MCSNEDPTQQKKKKNKRNGRDTDDIQTWEASGVDDDDLPPFPILA